MAERDQEIRQLKGEVSNHESGHAAMVWARPRPSSSLSVLRSKYFLYGTLVQARRPLSSPKRRFPAWSEKDTKLVQQLYFCSCIPTGIHGPTGIFWADLTPFSPGQLAERDVGERSSRSEREALLATDGEAILTPPCIIVH